MDPSAIALAALSAIPNSPVLVFDADARCIAVFGELIPDEEARFGKREAIIGRAAEEYMGGAAEGFRRAIASVLATGKSEAIRAPAHLPSGNFVFEVTLWPLAGLPLVACQLRNVSELDHLEQQLAASRSRFQAVVDPTAHFVCEVDANGMIVYVGPKVRELGIEPEALLGKSIIGLGARLPGTPPEEVAAADRAMLRFLQERSGLSPYVSRLRDSAGRLRTLENSGGWYTGSDGEPRGLLVCRDVEAPPVGFASDTRRQVALASLAGGWVDAAMEVTLDGKIVEATPFPATWAGSAEPLAGRDALSFVHPEDRARARRGIRRAIQRRGHEPALLRWRGSDNGWRWLEVRGVGFELENGEQRVITMGRDVTRERELREASGSSESVETLQRDNLALLAGGVAHDFNNLLTISLGVADLIAEQLAQDSPIRPYLNEIVAASRQAADLARQLLASTGRVSAMLVPVDVNAVLGSMEALLRSSLRGARLEYALSEGPLWIEGDATQLRQVVLNLVTNAGEAIGGESALVRVSTRRDRGAAAEDPAQSGHQVVIEVHDNGPGLEEETRQHIFEPRFTTKGTGRGLGLAVVQSVVRRHGGRIHVPSGAGGGTTFCIEIPALAEQRVVAERLLSSRLAEGPGSGASVLLVDDDRAVRRVGATMLGLAQFRVLEASGASEALDCLAREPNIACAVVDLVLPDGDGMALIEELRRRKPELRVVVCSGAVNRIPVDRPDLVVLEKPFRYAQLIEAVWRSLGGDRPVSDPPAREKARPLRQGRARPAGAAPSR